MSENIPTVLVIDDDPSTRRLLRLVLETHDFAVSEAQDGAEGLRKLEECDPDAVILDLEMPVVDGTTFCQRAEPKGRPPILVLSAGDARTAAQRLGASAWMEKPFDIDRLVRAVDFLVLERRQSMRSGPDGGMGFTQLAG